jgi:hypothetical protein
MVLDRSMKSRVRSCLAALGLALLVLPASAAPRAVVELFTSQGCSSCPPADALMTELARRPDVIGLTYPVDYWDYLGWKDTLAQPAFTARQRAYAHLRGDRQVYTPQVVVNGRKPCLGSDREQIDTFLKAADNGKPELPAEITLAEEDGKLVVRVAGDAEQPAAVWVLPVLKARTVAIGKGENSGRTVTYANVVRGLTRIGDWSGGSARFELPLATAIGDGDGYVVLLQVARGVKPGRILGAAKSSGL